jgi:hypothetical protein
MKVIQLLVPGANKFYNQYLKGYKPEVTNPQHTKFEIFKGKVKNKKLISDIGVLFSNKLFLTVNKHKNHMSLKILSLLSFGTVSLH